MIGLVLGLGACGHADDLRGTTAGGADLQGAEVKWTPALKQRWAQRVRTVDWMRAQLLVGALASASALKHGLPKQLSLHVQQQVGKTAWRVHFGRMTADGGTFVATHRVTVDHRQTSYEALASPEVLTGALGARARAVVTAKQYLDRRAAGWARRLQQQGAWFNHLVRTLPDGRVEVYLVAFASSRHRVFLGGDYRFLVTKDGGRVVSFRSLHGGTVVVSLKPGAEPVVMHHIHDARAGDLPTATDLLKVQQTPGLRGLVVIGPRLTLHLERHAERGVWATRLLDSRKYRDLLKRQP